MRSRQTLRADQVHVTWSARHEARLRVAPGETVEIWTRDGFDGQMESLSELDLDATLSCLDFKRIAPLTGPVWIDGAQPGDIAVVRIDELAPAGVGWTVIWPEWSTSEFVRPPTVGPGSRIFRFEERELASGVVSLAGTRVPLRPMVGMVGTAPAAGEFATLPPRSFGGNMDIRLASEGNSVLLPVFVEGALVSFGDGHAAQGDGEVCGTGIECSMRAVVTFDLIQSRSIEEPHVLTPQSVSVTAYGTDLDQAAKKAILFMHRELTEVRGLPPAEAFALMSIAGNLGVNQVVDAPHVGVRFSIPSEVIPK